MTASSRTRTARPGSVPPADGGELRRTASRSRTSNLYYGAFLAVQDVNMSIKPNKATALIGSSGCGKSTFLRSLNRMHELDRRRARGGTRSCSTAQDIYAPSVDPVSVRRRRSAWSSRRRTPSRRCRSTTTSRPGSSSTARRVKKSDLDEVVERSLRGAQPVGRGQGPPRQAGHRACRAASSSGCASRARSPSSPRCC